MAVLLIGYALMALCAALHLNAHVPTLDWGAAIWIFPYMVGMTLISYFGNFGTGGLFGVGGIFKNFWVGGQNDVNILIMMLVNAAFSLVIYYVAIHQRLPEAKVDEYIREVFPAPDVAH
jgi:hypothetical protein